jgi:3-oxoacyl-(acyl-carrier-protein) synthase
MVVAAVDCSSVFKQMWFNEIGVLAKDGRIKPFAADRDGFTIGDGGAALVLESLESAKSRKAAIYAEYLGSGFVLEGWKVIYPDVSNDYYADAMQRAIKGSGLNTSDIDLLVPHGVGANIIDNYEARAVRKVFGKDFEKPVITALKPYIGHTLGSTALLETAIMLLAIKGDVIPATLNCDKADPKLGINVLKDDISAKSVKTAMKTACGFAGFNAASVFKINN